MIRTSEAVAEISAAWVKCAGAMPNVPRGSSSNYGTYVSLDDLTELVRPVLHEHDLAYVQGCSDGEKFVTITTRLIHTSGEWIEDSLSVPTGQGTAQAVGSAITYARRYSLMAILGLAPEDDDGAAASTAPPRAKAQQQARPPAKKAGDNDKASSTLVTRVILALREKGISESEKRHEALTRILGHQIASTNDLTNAQATKVLDYLAAS